MNTIVGQIENIYDDLKDTTEIEQLRAVQQWVQMYPNTGESMNKCVYDVVKKAIKHIREDLISSANIYINDVIPDNSSLSFRVGNDPNATCLDVIAAKVGDISLMPALGIRTIVQYFIQKLKNISDACDDPKIRTYYRIYRLVLNTFPDSMNFYGIPVGRLLVWVHSLDDIVKSFDEQYLRPILEFHSEMINFLSQIKDYTETVENFSIQYNLINELSENDCTFYRNKIRNLWSWVINEENVKVLQDIHDIIEGIKNPNNPNNPSFPKDATKACSAHNNAFGVVTASGVNAFIEKIKSLKKELDKIPEGTCINPNYQAKAKFGEKHKSRRKHNHRSRHSNKIISTHLNSSIHKPHSTSSFTMSRSMSINSNSSTHNTRKKHNHSSFSKSMN